MNVAEPAATIASVRRARAEDVPRIVAMGVRFLGEVYRGKLTAAPAPARMAQTAAWLLESPDRVLLVSESRGVVTGMFGAFVFEHPFTGERLATELFWWVEPEHRGHGLRLLKAATRWAAEANATAIQMIAPDENVAALYQRLGYWEVERTFARRI